MQNKYNIAVIGPQDIISGFKALGAVPFNAENGEEAIEVLREMRQENQNPESESTRFAVVLIIENIYSQMPADDYAKVSRGALPAIIAVPGVDGATGAGIEKLKRLSEQAIGSDVLK